MITCWLTYIRLFDFDVKHIPGNKNGGADALSRCGCAPNDDPDDSDPDDYFDSQLYNLSTHSDQTTLTSPHAVHGPSYHLGRIYLLEGEYEGHDLMLE